MGTGRSPIGILDQPMRALPSPSAAGRSTALRLILAGALALVLGACGSTEPLTSASPIGAAPDESALRTAAVTDPLAEFEGRLRDATASEGRLVQSLASASAGSAADMRLAVTQMRDWVDDQRAWLAAHPADPCYDAAATKFEAAIDAIAASADWFESTVEASLAPSDDVSRSSAGTEAANSLQDASRALLDAAGLAKVARQDCR